MEYPDGVCTRCDDLVDDLRRAEAERDELQAMNQRQIETMEGMSKRHVEAYRRLAAANMYIRKLTAKLAVANWLLDEVKKWKDQIHRVENDPIKAIEFVVDQFGVLDSILAKRKGAE
jgi:hypothetical protein